MLRARAIISVRQQDHKTRLSKPFLFRASDKSVKNRLSRIEEVSELGLPHNKIVRIFQTVPVFVRKYSIFTQNTVENLESAFIVGKLFDRTVFAL